MPAKPSRKDKPTTVPPRTDKAIQTSELILEHEEALPKAVDTSPQAKDVTDEESTFITKGSSLESGNSSSWQRKTTPPASETFPPSIKATTVEKKGTASEATAQKVVDRVSKNDSIEPLASLSSSLHSIQATSLDEGFAANPGLEPISKHRLPSSTPTNIANLSEDRPPVVSTSTPLVQLGSGWWRCGYGYV